MNMLKKMMMLGVITAAATTQVTAVAVDADVIAILADKVSVIGQSEDFYASVAVAHPEIEVAAARAAELNYAKVCKLIAFRLSGEMPAEEGRAMLAGFSELDFNKELVRLIAETLPAMNGLVFGGHHGVPAININAEFIEQFQAVANDEEQREALAAAYTDMLNPHAQN